MHQASLTEGSKADEQQAVYAVPLPLWRGSGQENKEGHFFRLHVAELPLTPKHFTNNEPISCGLIRGGKLPKNDGWWVDA